MTALKDAGRLIRMVDIGGRDVAVTGVSLDGVVLLLDRFPEFRELITPSRGRGDTTEFTLEGLIRMSPRIMGAVIAAGIGEPGSAEAEEAAKRLPIGVQLKIIREIIDTTFPGGLGPFVEDLRAMGLLRPSAPEEDSSPSTDRTSSDESDATGRASAGSSSSQLSSSAAPDTPKS